MHNSEERKRGMQDFFAETCVNSWSDSRLMTLDSQLRRMEDEIVRCRSGFTATAPSSFSYYLYEKRLLRTREVWNRTLAIEGAEGRVKMYLLASDRIYNLIKQDRITEEDFPDNGEIREMRQEHYELCLGWMRAMVFGESVPE